MVVWILIIFRGIRARLKGESKGNMPWLFFFSALAIPAFYAVGTLANTSTHLSVAEFWRFWVVHLWVEDFLELFTTVMVAYIFVMLGVVRERIALGVIFLDVILYSAGGIIGTMHHLYFSGTPVEHMALGAFFSAAEVIPLTFLTIEAWSFLQLGSRQEKRSSGGAFPHRWAVMFLVAVGFWNFVGAGIFGFLVNLPIVSYYEIGTALTANHAHGAMMGVYGMLAVGLSMFALRYLIPADKWPEKLAKLSFWSLNIGLAWMVFAALLPLGVRQLYASVQQGYFEARSLNFVTGCGKPAAGVGVGCPVTCSSSSAAASRSCGSPSRACATPGSVRPPTSCRRTCCSPSSSRSARAGRVRTDVLHRRIAGVPLQRLLAGRGVRVRPDGPAGGGPGAALADRELSLPRRPRRLGPARRTSGCGPPRSTRSSGSCATGPNRACATPVRSRTPVPPRAPGAKSPGSFDPWPHSEAGRFHRGLACCIAGLAVFFPLGMLLSGPTGPETALLVGVATLGRAGRRAAGQAPVAHPEQLPRPHPTDRHL